MRFRLILAVLRSSGLQVHRDDTIHSDTKQEFIEHRANEPQNILTQEFSVFFGSIISNNEKIPLRNASTQQQKTVREISKIAIGNYAKHSCFSSTVDI